MLFPRPRWFAVALLAIGIHAHAVDQNIQQAIDTKLQAARSDLKAASVKETPFSGVYEVQIENGPTVYMSADGSYMIAGDLFQLEDQKLVNLTELPRNKARQDMLAQVDRKDMIIFSPANGKVKTSVTVFTDVDCGYCQKFHQEVPEMNELGIEVRYLAFPRAGIGSASYEKIATAWCADDRNATLTRLKNREVVQMDVCEDNPVAAQYLLGQQIGVRGTPALVTESGEMLPGYRPAKELAAELGIN